MERARAILSVKRLSLVIAEEGVSRASASRFSSPPEAASRRIRPRQRTSPSWPWTRGRRVQESVDGCSRLSRSERHE